MSPNPFDQACRHMLRNFAVPLLAWLLRRPAEQLDFVGWLDMRSLPWPGEPDRTCDTVAHLRDPVQGGLPWAVPVEFQIEPDSEMFGRGLIYLGSLWRECRPTEHRGDHFEVGLVVVNLRGRGRSSRRMHLSGTNLLTRLNVVERNLSRIPAGKTLERIASGRRPTALLPWIPLFQGADDPGIISGWRRLAELQTDQKLRQALGLTLYFAEAARRLDIWRPALEGFDVIESQVFKEWTDLAHQKGVDEGKIGALLRILGTKGTIPTDLEQVIRCQTDSSRLDTLIDTALASATIDDFRRATGL